MTLRNANLTDAGRLAELSELLGYPVEAEAIRRRLERLLAKPDHAVFVAEVLPKLVVGWIHAAEHDILEVGSFCEILGLVVAADHRGEQIGRCLVERVEQWARERG
jgi:GNAT superfamily N-acetyltransferase